MFPQRSFVAICLVSISAGAVSHPRGSVNETAPYSNTTFTSSLPASETTDSSVIYSITSTTILSSSSAIAGAESKTSRQNDFSQEDSPKSPGPTAFANATSSTVDASQNATSALDLSSATTAPPPEASSNATLSVPYPFRNATLPVPKPTSNATCTVNIPSASVDWWFPPTYSHLLGTMTTSAANFTNADSLTLVPHTTTFDPVSALASDYACTSSVTYVSEWDFSYTVCMDYTDKPTAAATSIAYRTAAAPFPPGGVIPATDARLYDLYTDGQPSATTTISAAPNVTFTETSATPFVYFTAYEVESGNRTLTVQLRSAAVYPYWLKGVEQEQTATGPLPDGFLEQIPQSDCDAGQLQATVTVIVVVDLYYQNLPNANPFIVHAESSAIGFDDPIVSVAGEENPEGPLTVSDFELPGDTKPTSTYVAVDPTPTGSSNNDNPGIPEINGPLPSRVTVGTIGTDPVVVGPSSVVVVGSQTVQPGAPPIVVGGVTPVSLAPSATAIVVDGTTSQLPVVNVPPQQPQQPQQPQPPVLTIGSSTLTPNAATQFFVAPGQTLTPGGVVTLDGTVVSLAPSASFVVIGGSTQPLAVAPATTNAPQIVVGGSTITALPTVDGNGTPNNPNNPSPGPTFIVADQTLTPGGPAITVSGTTLSLAPSGSFVVVNGVTSTIATPAAPVATPPSITVGNEVFSPLVGSGTTFVIASQTLTPGGPAITVSGTTFSLAPSASFVVINGVTSTFASPASPRITPPPLTIGNSVVQPLLGTGTSYLIGSSTLTPGGVVVVDGTTISLAPGATALIINGQTSIITPSTQPIITNAPLLTIGSQTYTAVSGTTFVIGGQTLTPGGTITVDGTTISLAPGATELIYGSSGRTTTTALFPATTTRSQSITSTVSPSAGSTGRTSQPAATSQRTGSASQLQSHSWFFSSLIAVLGFWLA